MSTMDGESDTTFIDAHPPPPPPFPPPSFSDSFHENVNPIKLSKPIDKASKIECRTMSFAPKQQKAPSDHAIIIDGKCKEWNIKMVKDQINQTIKEKKWEGGIANISKMPRGGLFVLLHGQGLAQKLVQQGVKLEGVESLDVHQAGAQSSKSKATQQQAERTVHFHIPKAAMRRSSNNSELHQMSSPKSAAKRPRSSNSCLSNLRSTRVQAASPSTTSAQGEPQQHCNHKLKPRQSFSVGSSCWTTTFAQAPSNRK